MKILRSLSLLIHSAVSLAAPLLVCILGSRWLVDRYALGRWVMAVGILLGVGGSVYSLVRCIRQMMAIPDDESTQPPVSFNNHD